MFNSEQIKKLLLLIDNADDLVKLLDIKLILQQDDDKKRSIKSFNIDDNIYNFIKTKSKKSGLSLSDIVNLMLKESMKYMD